jgi:CPA2 family monovalent cation:H+ antiporter-2
VHGAVVLLELGGVILGLGILGRLAGRLGLSAIPLYLLAGLAFGEGGLLPLVTAQEFIEVGAEVGVILLLLLLGLEYSASELTANLRAHAPAGLVDLVLNLTPGVAAGLLLGWSPLAAVVLGGVTYVTSSGIVAKVLEELGRIGNRETPVVLSILVVEDLAMAAYLPLVSGLLLGGGLLASALPVGIALASVALVLLVAVRYGETLSRLVFSPSDEVLLLVILGVALEVAGIAQQLNVSAAVGAFLVGIALSGEAAEAAHGLLAPLRDLFAAVFFVFFGLQTDPGSIPPVALAAVALALVTAATKVATGWWAARRAGVGTRGRWRAGTVLVARGEFSIVIAGLAVSAGAEPTLGPLAATYVLILAVLGPLLARFIEPMVARAPRPLRRRRPAAPGSERGPRSGPGPSRSGRGGPAEPPAELAEPQAQGDQRHPEHQRVQPERPDHGDGPLAGTQHQEEPEEDREDADERQQPLAPQLAAQPDRDHDLEQAGGDRPRGDQVQQHQGRDPGPDERHDPGRDPGDALHQQPAAPVPHQLPADEQRGEGEQSVDQRVEAEQQHQRAHGDVRPDPGDHPEGHRQRAAEGHGPPVP